VDGTGDQLLSRAGLSQQQHRGIAGGHHIDQLQHPPQRPALSHDPIKARLEIFNQ
jgi:hypothetical protein